MWKRIHKELDDFKSDPPGDAVVWPINEDIWYWEGFFEGPKKSPYEGGTFEFKIDLKEDYPNSAPTIKFVTPIFHPNINETSGSVCIDVLGGNWSPKKTIAEALICVYAMLEKPYPESPLNRDAANLVVADRVFGTSKFFEKARLMTKKYASKPFM